ncbi:F0F1 ATP synthase subunit delta [Clostridium perfringens]
MLGGVLVRLGNTQIDGSVKTRLDNIKDQLSRVIS